MLRDYAETPSYNAGEQGFTNSRYPHLAQMPLFNPATSSHTVAIRVPEFQNDHTRLTNTYNGDVALYYLRDETWKSGPPKVIHYTMLYFKPWNWYEYIIFPLNWEWYRQLPLDTENVLVTASRFVSPVVLLYLAWWLPPQSLKTSTSAAPLRVWASGIDRAPWLYALFALIAYWVFVFAVCFTLTFAMIPGIPQLHPCVSGLLLAFWIISVIALSAAVVSRWHVRLGMLVSKTTTATASMRPSSSIWPKFRAVVAFAIGMCVYFVARSTTIVHGPAALVEAGVMVSTTLLALSSIFYRLPLVAFREGQQGTTSKRLGHTVGDL